MGTAVPNVDFLRKSEPELRLIWPRVLSGEVVFPQRYCRLSGMGCLRDAPTDSGRLATARQPSLRRRMARYRTSDTPRDRGPRNHGLPMHLSSLGEDEAAKLLQCR